MVDHDNTYNDDIKVFSTFGHANLVRRGLLWAVTHNVNFGFLAAHRLSYASAMSEIMSGAKLHTYLPNKKEISKSLLLDQLPQCPMLLPETRFNSQSLSKGAEFIDDLIFI